MSDDHEAFDLFSANAFPGERRLSDDYKKLASTVVRIEERLDVPNPDIQEALEISYNSLEDLVKEVFLDIACFFKGEDKDHVIQILEGCGLNPEYGLKVLKEKALIHVNEDNSIWMHNLIEEMEKEIIRQESLLKPDKRSRLWSHEDVYQVLTEGIVSIRLLTMNPNSKITWRRGLGGGRLLQKQLICLGGLSSTGQHMCFKREQKFFDGD
ncbi:hypothetical protein Prudu_021979 [Prunus dulcis]|uniref:Disease resistance protein Roq1-like winged-helix domain-containing protein n=1 Tax=Prunus dulcis TaxID=3755 RepID=A0A4Y1RYH8_PRUDU|nr:hypothetical protein Prudu_021979 [Prunus dulcis]